MSEQWWAVYEKTSGVLVSVGSTEIGASAEANARRVPSDAALAAKGFVKAALADRPTDAIMWSEADRRFVPRPMKDYVTLFFNDPQVAVLFPETRAMLEDRIGRYFGRRRVGA